MLDQESAGYLSLYPLHIKALVEDIAKSLSIVVEKPTSADVETGRVTIIPVSTQLADAHYNAGFIRRSCQNHGIHVTWNGEKKPEDLDLVCVFTFITVAEHEKRKEEAAKPAPAPAPAPAPVAVKPAAPAVGSGTLQPESKPSTSLGNNSK